MNYPLWELAILSAVLVGALACCEIGYRLGRRKSEHEGTGAIEAAILGLLGLILAFSFGAAQSRLETRRAQIVEEANAIGTAYLRLDLLPASDQEALRKLFRRYVDVRLRVYQNISDRVEHQRALQDGEALQREIWHQAETASSKEQWMPVAMLLLPAINQMIDITTARTLMLQTRNPAIVTGLLLFLTAVSAIVAGFAMSKGKSRMLLHMVLYSITISVTVCTVIDLDHPRSGFIRIESADKMLVQLRSTMN